MKLKYQFVVQKVADGYVAVAVGKDAAKFNGIIRMNKTGAAMFELLKRDTTEDKIVAAILDRFEAREEDVRADARKLLGKLREEKVLTD